jgi:hypothetical protein
MTTFAQLDRARSTHRAIAWRALLAIAVLAPTCVLFVQVWGNQSRNLATLANQRHGVAYVRAVESAIAAVVTAQSAAVAGRTPDLQPVDRAALAVAALDSRYGAVLRTRVIWADADNRIQQLHSRGPAAPADAYAAYSDVTGALLSLADKVRITSGLSSDSHADTAAMQDAAAGQLPDAMVAAGQYADLVKLTGAPSADSPAASSGAESIADQRARIQRDAAAVATDLQGVSDASPDAAVSRQMLVAADRFSLAVNALVGADPGPSARASSSAATALQASANSLSTAMLDSADALSASRMSSQHDSRSATIGIAVAAVVIALVPLLLLAVRRRESESAIADEFGADGSGVSGAGPPAPGAPAALDVPVPAGEAAWAGRSHGDLDADAAVRAHRAPVSATPNGRERFGEGQPLPRRRPLEPPTLQARPMAGRELMPATVANHRPRPDVPPLAAPPSDGSPSDGARADWLRADEPRAIPARGASPGSDDALNDEWGRTSVPR